MSSDDIASWHNLNKTLLSILLGNLFHLNLCLSSLVLSPGSWCVPGMALGVAARLSLPAPGAAPCPHRTGLPGQEAGGGASSG